VAQPPVQLPVSASVPASITSGDEAPTEEASANPDLATPGQQLNESANEESDQLTVTTKPSSYAYVFPKVGFAGSLNPHGSPDTPGGFTKPGSR
jgi:hypothetical protein